MRSVRPDRLGPAGELHPPWIEHRPSHSWWTAFRLSNAWAQRDLGVQLALRDVKLRYKQTAFGIAWAVLRPLLALGIFSVIFGHFAKLPSDGVPYPVFLLAGLAFWTFLSSAVDAAAHSLAHQRALVEKVWFPRVIAPIASVLGALPDLVVPLVMLVIAMAAWGVAPPLRVLTLPVWIVSVVVVASGVSIWLAALNVLYRDVEYALSFLLQLWLYASPVIYPSSLVHGTIGWLLALNPAVFVLDGVRWSLFGGAALTARDLVSAIIALAVLATGLVYFAHVERDFADRI